MKTGICSVSEQFNFPTEFFEPTLTGCGKIQECFDRLSTNGKCSINLSTAPFVLRFSKGER